MVNKIVIASDHAGYFLKEKIKGYFESNDLKINDMGTYSDKSTDYPDYIHPLAKEISEGNYQMGIIICGSANGVSMTANKHENVRSAIAWNTEIAELARLHNDANILALPARYISEEEAIEIVKTFLKTKFEGGRHQRRINKININ